MSELKKEIQNIIVDLSGNEMGNDELVSKLEDILTRSELESNENQDEENFGIASALNELVENAINDAVKNINEQMGLEGNIVSPEMINFSEDTTGEEQLMLSLIKINTYKPTSDTYEQIMKDVSLEHKEEMDKFYCHYRSEQFFKDLEITFSRMLEHNDGVINFNYLNEVTKLMNTFYNIVQENKWMMTEDSLFRNMKNIFLIALAVYSNLNQIDDKTRDEVEQAIICKLFGFCMNIDKGEVADNIEWKDEDLAEVPNDNPIIFSIKTFFTSLLICK